MLTGNLTIIGHMTVNVGAYNHLTIGHMTVNVGHMQ